MNILTKCDFCLTISKIEDTICKGIGINSHLYPYLPEGKILQDLQLISSNRDCANKSRMMAIISTYDHQPSREGVIQFINQIKYQFNQVSKIDKILIVGKNSEKYSEYLNIDSRIQCLGWVSQEELIDLLSDTMAMIIPQTIGFGALTKISEFVLANIPIIVSQYPTRAMNLRQMSS